MTAGIASARTARLTAVALLAILTRPLVAAEGAQPAPPPAWQSECGSCHVAYPPRFLPAESWRRLMGSLGDHFGSDASVEPAQAALISAWLDAGAGRTRQGEQVPLRITTRKWFRGEHDEIARPTWASTAVGSPANCDACHTRAAEGSFRERDIRIPEGGRP
jgi:hypothetical protein